MTAKEAIRRIEEHNKVHRLAERNAILITEALNMAIAALEKQIPKEPSDIICLESSNLEVGRCDICGRAVDHHMQYCDKCGQALNWSDSDD